MTTETGTQAVLRERLAEALQDAAREPSGEVYARPGALADALLPVVARYCEQLEAGRETWRRKAAEIEADRDRLAAEVEGVRRLLEPWRGYVPTQEQMMAGRYSINDNRLMAAVQAAIAALDGTGEA